MITARRWWTFVFCLFVLASCAQIDSSREWDRTKRGALELTGYEPRWARSDEAKASVRTEIDRLLSDGLTMDEAVHIALMNNAKMQASFEEIGIAAAEYVRAGLPANPAIGAAFRFPSGQGDTEIDADMMIDLAALWQIPRRSDAARTKNDVTRAVILDEMARVVTEVTVAFMDCLALSMIREEGLRLKRELDEWASHLRYRRGFGFTSDVEMHTAGTVIAEQEIELIRIGSAEKSARARLTRLLGLKPGRARYDMKGSIDYSVAPMPDYGEALTAALTRRPDVQAAELRVTEAGHLLSLERTRVLPHLEAGISFSHDHEGKDAYGPAFALQLPVFDRNQAQISAAEHRLRQAERELEEKKAIVGEEVAEAIELLMASRQEVTILKDRLLPLRREAVIFTEKYVNAMELTMLNLFEARLRLFEAQRRFIEAMRDSRKREIEFARATGRLTPTVPQGHKGQ